MPVAVVHAVLAVGKCPDDPAIDNGPTVLTYREFHAAAEEVAGTPNGLGIGRGDRGQTGRAMSTLLHGRSGRILAERRPME